MNIAVCVKQIPEPTSVPSLEGDNTLNRSGKLVLDDSDTFGVELGIRLAEEHGGEVTLVSMAPRGETSGILTGLAMGAHRAIVVSDDSLSGSDALSTAKVLSAAIARIQPDIVLAATESTDGYTGTVPVQIAELLGMPSITFAKNFVLEGQDLTVSRQTESGYDDVRCSLPAVVTVTGGVVEPRYPSFKGIMSAKSKPIDVLSLSDLNIDPSTVGSAGARQEIVEVADVPARSSGEIIEDDGHAEERIIAYLEELRIL